MSDKKLSKQEQARADEEAYKASLATSKPMEQVIKEAVQQGGSEDHWATATDEPAEYVDPALEMLNNEHLTDETYEPEPEKPLIETDTSTATLKAMLRVAESMEKITARQEEFRQVPFAEVKPVSSFNPTGRRDHPTFRRPTFMDGIPLNSLMHTPEEIQLFNQIKPGRYWNRRIEVRRGSSGEIDLIRIGSRLDQRMERNAAFPTLTSMLKAIILERDQQEQRRRSGQFEDDEALP